MERTKNIDKDCMKTYSFWFFEVGHCDVPVMVMLKLKPVMLTAVANTLRVSVAAVAVEALRVCPWRFHVRDR